MNAPVTINNPQADDRFNNEVGLIGALLMAGDVTLYRAASAIVGPQHFNDKFNARLFSLMGRGFDEGLFGFKLNIWLLGKLRGDQTLEELNLSGSAMIARYCACAIPAVGVEGAARQVVYDRLNDDLHGFVEDGDTEGAQAAAAEMDKLSKAHLTRNEGLAQIGASALSVINTLNDAFSNGEIRDDGAWPGSHALAGLFGGWRKGRLYIIGGRPAMGKSTWALSTLLRTAIKGHGVMCFSLEMSREELTEMALCDLAWEPSRRIEYRDLQLSHIHRPGFDRKLEAVILANDRLQNIPFTIMDRPGLTLAEIRSQALQYRQYLAARGKRLDVICVDHMGLVRPSERYAGNKVAETEEISNALKVMAKELDCAVIALCQLNRGVEGRENKKPTLADLRMSGAIEQDADFVGFVYREAYYLQHTAADNPDDAVKLDQVRNEMELIVAKNRGGPTQNIKFFCDLGCAVVRDLGGRQ